VALSLLTAYGGYAAWIDSVHVSNAAHVLLVSFMSSVCLQAVVYTQGILGVAAVWCVYTAPKNTNEETALIRCQSNAQAYITCSHSFTRLHSDALAYNTMTRAHCEAASGRIHSVFACELMRSALPSRVVCAARWRVHWGNDRPC
jgi:hypothetical protein